MYCPQCYSQLSTNPLLMAAAAASADDGLLSCTNCPWNGLNSAAVQAIPDFLKSASAQEIWFKTPLTAKAATQFYYRQQEGKVLHLTPSSGTSYDIPLNILDKHLLPFLTPLDLKALSLSSKTCWALSRSYNPVIDSHLVYSQYTLPYQFKTESTDAVLKLLEDMILACVHPNGSVFLWDLNTARQNTVTLFKKKTAHKLLFINTNLIFFAFENTVEIWDIRLRQKIHESNVPRFDRDHVPTSLIRLNASLIAIGYKNGYIYLFNINEKKVHTYFLNSTHSAITHFAVISEKHFVFSDTANRINIIEIPTLEVQHSLPYSILGRPPFTSNYPLFYPIDDTLSNITSLLYCPSNNILLGSTLEGHILIWYKINDSLSSNSAQLWKINLPVHSLLGFENSVVGLTGKMAQIILGDQKKFQLTGHQHTIVDACVLPDKGIVSLDKAGNIKIWLSKYAAIASYRNKKTNSCVLL
jgi:hypothetical protein